jgi:serine/threonine protein kinase
MSRVLKEDIEGRTVNTFGPVGWMSPESLENQVYSKKSDVWMFGMLVYEIVARREPHSDWVPLNITAQVRFDFNK